MQERNNQNNENNQPLIERNNIRENTLILNKDFFIPWTSLSTNFGIYNEYYSLYKNSPRKNSLFYFFQSILFPNLLPTKITFIIGILNVIIYIITLSYGLESTNKEDFLSPKMTTLDKFGYFCPYSIKENKYNLYRCLTANFLHLNLRHLLFNTFGLFMFCSLFEMFIKKYQFLLIYIICGFCGYCSSGRFYNEKDWSVGSNSSIFGIHGAFTAFFILNWRELNRNFGDWGKFYCLYFLSILSFIFFLFYLVSNFIDIFSQVSGAYYGFLFYSVFFTPINSSKCKKIWRIISLIILLTSVFLDVYFYL